MVTPSFGIGVSSNESFAGQSFLQHGQLPG